MDFQPNMDIPAVCRMVVKELFLKQAPRKLLLILRYYDTIPWPVEADGDGYSLVSVEANPTGDPNNHEYWTISKYLNGSPMANDENSIITDVFVAETNDFELMFIQIRHQHRLTLIFQSIKMKR